jgi:hypothetical protein
VTDRRDRGEAGPGGQRSGCEREREREAGWWWGTDMRVRNARFKLDLN